MSEYPKQIYAIYPLDKDGNITGVYVGSAWSAHDRIKNHLSAIRETDPQPELHKQMRVYGFQFQILGQINAKEDSYLEYVWIDFFKEQGLKTYNTYLNIKGKANKSFFEKDYPVWTGKGVVWKYNNQTLPSVKQNKAKEHKETFQRAYMVFEKVRNSKGFKDSEIAALTGITRSTFSDWKSGRSAPKPMKLIKIAAVLEVPLEAFFEKEGK